MRSITFVRDVMIPHDSIRMLLTAKSAILGDSSLSVPMFQTSNLIAAVKIDESIDCVRGIPGGLQGIPCAGA